MEGNVTKFNRPIEEQIKVILRGNAIEWVDNLIGHQADLLNYSYHDFFITQDSILNYLENKEFESDEILVFMEGNFVNYDIKNGIPPTGRGEMWLEKTDNNWEVYWNQRGHKYGLNTFTTKKAAIEYIVNFKMEAAKMVLKEK